MSNAIDLRQAVAMPIASKATMSTYLPITAGNYADNSVARIIVSSGGAWADLRESVFRGTITFTGASGASGTMDGSFHSMLQAVRVYSNQSGALLEEVSNYNVLADVLKKTRYGPGALGSTFNMTEGFPLMGAQVNATAGTGRTIAITSTLTQSFDFAIRLESFFNHLPTHFPLCHTGGLIYEFVFAPFADVLASNTNLTSYAVSGIKMMVPTIAYPEEFNADFRQAVQAKGAIAMTGQARALISRYNLSGAETSVSIPLSIRAQSLKAIVLAFNAPSSATTCTVGARLSVNPKVQLRAGNEVQPQVPLYGDVEHVNELALLKNVLVDGEVDDVSTYYTFDNFAAGQAQAAYCIVLSDAMAKKVRDGLKSGDLASLYLDCQSISLNSTACVASVYGIYDQDLLIGADKNVTRVY